VHKRRISRRQTKICLELGIGYIFRVVVTHNFRYIDSSFKYGCIGALFNGYMSPLTHALLNERGDIDCCLWSVVYVESDDNSTVIAWIYEA